MLMTIYVDYLVIDNMSFDCFLLWLACKSARQPVVWWRLILAGLLGAACALVSVFCKGALLVFVKLAFVVPMCATVVGKRRLLVVTLLFVAYTFLLGGAILGLLSLFQVDYQLNGNLNYYASVPIGFFVAGIFCVLLLCQWLTRYLTAQKRVLQSVVKVTLTLPNQTLVLDAFCDSGNLLCHNNLPVCFAVGSFAKDFSQTLAQQILCGNVQTICYSTVSGDAKCLAVKCKIASDNVQKDCYLALSTANCNVDYQILLNGEFI